MSYFFLIFVVAAFVMTVTWPYMGSSFFKHFLKMFFIAKNFPWEGKIFFQGVMYAAKSVPRSFIPTLLFIQTPVFILILMLGSLLFIKKESSRKIYFLLWLTLIINLVLYLILKPVSFIRHYLYLFPVSAAIAAISVGNFLESFKNKIQKGVFLCLLFFGMSYVTLQIIRLFPYEYIYYNELAGGAARAQKSYEIDLWAQSNKEAVSWLADHTRNQGEISTVYVCGNNFTASYFFPAWLKLAQKVSQADYMICSNVYSDEDKKIDGMKLHEITRVGIPVNMIYSGPNTKKK